MRKANKDIYMAMIAKCVKQAQINHEHFNKADTEPAKTQYFNKADAFTEVAEWLKKDLAREMLPEDLKHTVEGGLTDA